MSSITHYVEILSISKGRTKGIESDHLLSDYYYLLNPKLTAIANTRGKILIDGVFVTYATEIVQLGWITNFV